MLTLSGSCFSIIYELGAAQFSESLASYGCSDNFLNLVPDACLWLGPWWLNRQFSFGYLCVNSLFLYPLRHSV